MSASRLEDIKAFLRLSDTLGTAGQPTEAQFAAVKDAGFDIVVNLALTTSSGALPDERAVVSKLGMEYVHLPVNWDAPMVEDAARFFEVMDANRDKHCFVHCAANMRVSAFVYLYRVLRRGVADEDAARDLHRIWVPEGGWQRFIEAVRRAEEKGEGTPE